MNKWVLAEAQRLVASGLSVIPILPDGTKRPAVAWKCYQVRRPLPAELQRWFAYADGGLAIIGGTVNGQLEILDFDAPETFTPWGVIVDAIAPDLLARLPLVQTPTDGKHVYYRSPVIEGNQKLAQRPDAKGRPEVMIETRGEGGYAIIPPSPPACHPDHKPYVLLDGDLADIPRITPTEREILLNAARVFNTYEPPQPLITRRPERPRAQPQGKRPGDDYATRTSWDAILEPHGYVKVRSWKGATLWRRPGKRKGWSVVAGGAEPGLLWAYSSNAAPFEPERPYSKFAACALLNHGGDFSAAAKALAAQGYGEGYHPVQGGLRTVDAQRVRARGGIRTIPSQEVPPWR